MEDKKIDVFEVSDHAAHVASVDGHGLGRRVALDTRDNRYLASPPRMAEIERRSMHWIMPKALNQGRKPHCVAFAWEALLLSSPVKNKMYKTPAELYAEAQKVDEWEGENYDGTSVRAGAKVLQTAGYLSRYEWAFNVAGVVRQVLTSSPVVVGTDWYAEMSEPFDFNGQAFIRRGGNFEGGHAWVIKGINLDRPCWCGTAGVARMLNSWGESWGDKGKAWVCLKDLDQLIAAWGEACMATELRFKAVG